MNSGTPNNLEGAIKNAFTEFYAKKYESPKWRPEIDPEQVKIIRAHVQDFLAQKFQVAKFQAHQGRFKTENHLQILFDVCTKTSTCVNKD